MVSVGSNVSTAYRDSGTPPPLDGCRFQIGIALWMEPEHPTFIHDLDARWINPSTTTSTTLATDQLIGRIGFGLFTRNDHEPVQDGRIHIELINGRSCRNIAAARPNTRPLKFTQAGSELNGVL
jgi:hypothetical protein